MQMNGNFTGLRVDFGVFVLIRMAQLIIYPSFKSADADQLNTHFQFPISPPSSSGF